MVYEIFTLKQVKDNAYRHKAYLYLLFIDFKQCLTISRIELYKTMESLQVPVKLESKVKDKNNILRTFQVDNPFNDRVCFSFGKHNKKK